MKSENNKRLPILDQNNVTCYEFISQNETSCMKSNCKNWISFPKGKNCVLITTKNGPLTLGEIGKIYGLTRMRICQIEKSIYQKIRNLVMQSLP